MRDVVMTGDIGDDEYEMHSVTPDADQKRQVEFRILSDLHTSAELQSILGRTSAPPWQTRNLPRGFWAIRAIGDGTTDMSALIERVLAEAMQLRPILLELARSEGLITRLVIVHYVGSSLVGPGFFVDEEAVRFLADVGAALDMDQYWMP